MSFLSYKVIYFKPRKHLYIYSSKRFRLCSFYFQGQSHHFFSQGYSRTLPQTVIRSVYKASISQAHFVDNYWCIYIYTYHIKFCSTEYIYILTAHLTLISFSLADRARP